MSISLTSLHLFTTTPSSRITFYPPITSSHLTFHIPPHHKPLSFFTSSKTHRFKPSQSTTSTTTITTTNHDSTLDSLLSFAESLCLVSSTVVSIGFAVNFAVLGSKKTVLDAIVNSRVLVLGVVMLVSGVAVGAWIRRRQWRRICYEGGGGGGQSVNLIERIEKLEEDLKSSATIIRVLSRQLEKLGIRFRITRKALKEPIAEV